jgi:hypothetical protein
VSIINRNSGRTGRRMDKATLANLINAHVNNGHIGSVRGHRCIMPTGLLDACGTSLKR